MPKIRSVFVSLVAVVLFTCVGRAMEIRQFDKMSIDDQADFINVLVDGAQKVLIDAVVAIWQCKSISCLRTCIQGIPFLLE